MVINETNLTNGCPRKLKALRISVGDDLGAIVFAKRLVSPAASPPKPKSVTVAVKITTVLAGLDNDRTFHLANCHCTISRAIDKGLSVFIASKARDSNKSFTTNGARSRIGEIV